jgi:hypothetical protein
MKNGSSGSRATVVRVHSEIDTLRSELGGLVAELDRRRHEALDLRLQVKRHPVLVAVVATTAALVVGGALAILVQGRRERRRPAVRARQARHAFARLMEHPDRVAAVPSIGNKVATAVAVALVTGLAKRLLDRSIPPATKRA